MVHKVKLGRAIRSDSATADQRGYTLRGVEPPLDDREAQSGDGSLSRYLNYVLAAMVVLILIFALVNLVVGGSSHHGPIVAEMEKENALAKVESVAEREQIMAQALRVDRAEALGNTAQIRRELEKLMVMGKGDTESSLHRLCVKRLRSLK